MAVVSHRGYTVCFLVAWVVVGSQLSFLLLKYLYQGYCILRDLPCKPAGF